ncbi:helix-turn-helix domain-containing protein [Flagellimonas sp. HMM57]|nr:helix-turn-helix domain-containing protein [Flagellimonas sp. HMM57]UII76506.1 helix-turn-helix domain-containing protein [Flagellimonas sp. HMM57]
MKSLLIFFVAPFIWKPANATFLNTNHTDRHKKIEQTLLFKGNIVIKNSFFNKILHHCKGTEAADFVKGKSFAGFYMFPLTEGEFEVLENIGEEKSLNEYMVIHDIWSFFYLSIAIIGFYIALSFYFKRKKEVVAKLLISSFIFIHSYFIFCLYLNISNYHYVYPNVYLISASFLFLYGPLLYFYFKRIIQQYAFKKLDFIHLLPSVLLWIYLAPYYALSTKDKVEVIFASATNDDNPTYTNSTALLMLVKLCSMVIYGVLIYRVYLKSKQNTAFNNSNKRWQRNIAMMYFLYMIIYATYVVLYTSGITMEIFYHLQTIALISMVAYIAYSVNVQPKVFSGMYAYNFLMSDQKYHNSGLTEKLSEELIEKLMVLLERDKIYRQNNISLGCVAQLLDTNRHNTSQLINENFHMTFHELINTYRIKEAKKLLGDRTNGYRKIIDIAYEVGYNNKSTFNKAFKKNTQVTPSEYQEMSSTY